MDSSDAPTIFLALCAIVAQIGVAFSALLWVLSKSGVPVAKRWLSDIRVLVDPNGLTLAFVVALVATAGSLYFSEGRHFTPCRLCWYQRIAMYPLVPLLLVAMIRKDRNIRIYVMIQATIGALISTYHVLVENKIITEKSGLCEIANPCTIKWIEEFGYLTIPVMALSAFLAIVALMLMMRKTDLAGAGNGKSSS